MIFYRVRGSFPVPRHRRASSSVRKPIIFSFRAWRSLSSLEGAAHTLAGPLRLVPTRAVLLKRWHIDFLSPLFPGVIVRKGFLKMHYPLQSLFPAASVLLPFRTCLPHLFFSNAFSLLSHTHARARCYLRSKIPADCAFFVAFRPPTRLPHREIKVQAHTLLALKCPARVSPRPKSDRPSGKNASPVPPQ